MREVCEGVLFFLFPFLLSLPLTHPTKLSAYPPHAYTCLLRIFLPPFLFPYRCSSSSFFVPFAAHSLAPLRLHPSASTWPARTLLSRGFARVAASTFTFGFGVLVRCTSTPSRTPRVASPPLPRDSPPTAPCPCCALTAARAHRHIRSVHASMQHALLFPLCARRLHGCCALPHRLSVVISRRPRSTRCW